MAGTGPLARRRCAGARGRRVREKYGLAMAGRGATLGRMDLSGIVFPMRRADGGYLGMTTLQEQAWCRDYGARRHTGAGALVELGCFFGSLTIPFAEGLRAAALAGRLRPEQAVVDAYDVFWWHHSMEEAVAGSPLAGRLREGEWFVEICRANTAHVLPYARIHWEDLTTYQWPGGVIELLLLDCLKYDAVTNPVVRGFFPATRPGLSRIAHQDYFHFYEWWSHVITFEQRDLLEIEEEVPHSGMLVLRVTGDLGPYCSAYDPQRAFARTPPALIEDAYAWNYRVIQPANHDALTAARMWAYIQTGDLDTARRLYADTRARYGASPHYAMLTGYCASQGIAFPG